MILVVYFLSGQLMLALVYVPQTLFATTDDFVEKVVYPFFFGERLSLINLAVANLTGYFNYVVSFLAKPMYFLCFFDCFKTFFARLHVFVAIATIVLVKQVVRVVWFRL